MNKGGETKWPKAIRMEVVVALQSVMDPAVGKETLDQVLEAGEEIPVVPVVEESN